MLCHHRKRLVVKEVSPERFQRQDKFQRFSLAGSICFICFRNSAAGVYTRVHLSFLFALCQFRT